MCQDSKRIRKSYVKTSVTLGKRGNDPVAGDAQDYGSNRQRVGNHHFLEAFSGLDTALPSWAGGRRARVPGPALWGGPPPTGPTLALSPALMLMPCLQHLCPEQGRCDHTAESAPAWRVFVFL